MPTSYMLLDSVWDLCEKEVFPISSTDGLFNHYRDVHPELDLPDAAGIRRANLKAYLESYTDMPDVFLLAEAPGPWGCRFSGVPITSEAQLLDPDFPLQGRRTSSAEAPHVEYSAGIHWRVLAPYFPRFLTWNTVPFHPHKTNEPLSIRTPRASEIDAFDSVLERLIDIIRPRHVGAVGRKAERALGRIGVDNTYVRHPSQGGATRFEEGVRALLNRAGIS